MAQRKTAAQKKAEAEAAEAAVVAPPEEAPAVGVFITKETDGEGNLTVNIAPIGVEVTEVQTLIEVGLKVFREQIGLSSRAGR